MKDLMKEINAMALFIDIKNSKPGDVFKLSDYELLDKPTDNEHGEEHETCK